MWEQFSVWGGATCDKYEQKCLESYGEYFVRLLFNVLSLSTTSNNTMQRCTVYGEPSIFVGLSLMNEQAVDF